MWETYVSFTQFCCEPKTALKKKAYFKKRKGKKNHMVILVGREKACDISNIYSWLKPIGTKNWKQPFHSDEENCEKPIVNKNT